ncbi:undecaprenyl-phosphate galactose phosphotransferase WbaP [Desulfovibrio sp.]
MEASLFTETVLRKASCRPWLMPLVLAASDLLAVTAAWAVCVLVRQFLGGDFTLSTYFSLWPLGGLYLAIYAALGGYRLLLHPPREMKICTLGTSLAALVFAALTFWLRNPLEYSRSILLAATLLLLVLVPAARLAARSFFTRFPWWGHGAVFHGFDSLAPEKGAAMFARLNPAIRPLALLSLGPVEGLADLSARVGVPAFDGSKALAEMGRRRVSALFVVLAGAGSAPDTAGIIEAAAAHFTKTIILHDAMYLGNHWGRTVDVGHLLGLEVVQRLLDPKRMLLKKSLDILLSLLLLVVALPLMGLIALCVRLDSPGPALYRHSRVGRGGRMFEMFKFRTMRSDSEEVFREIIMADGDLRRDWEADHKLRHDPRVTRVGRFLRRTSLDELPQLLNVLAGDMSLIGPRPIVPAEADKYGDVYDMYLRVLPGMTGLWQVSGRSVLGYAERVELDAYYIKNWSFWLDLYILLKTPAAMCNLRAAY